MNNFVPNSDIKTKNKLNKIILIFVLFILSICQILFAIYRYPLIGSDGIAFLPAAINYSQDKGLINEVYNITRILNKSTAPFYFINYPPLFPLSFGTLLKYTLNLHMNYAIIHILSMLTFVFYVTKKTDILISNIQTFLLCLFLIAWNTQLNPGIGRPESLGQLFFLLFLAKLFFSTNLFSTFASGFLVVFIGFTHPVLGIYSLLILALNYSYKSYDIKSIAYTIFGCGVSLLFIIYLYPYDFMDLISGIMRHGRIVTARFEFSLVKFSHYHFFNPDCTFYLVIFLFSFFLYLKIAIDLFSSAKSKPLYILFNILLLTSIFYFTFQTIEASYNLYVLFPLFGFILMYKSDFILQSLNKYAILFALFLSTLGYLRRLVLFPVHIEKGLSYVEAKRDISMKISSPGIIFVSTSMFILLDSMSNLTDDLTDPNLEYILQQQNYSAYNKPLDIKGFHLIHSTFTHGEVKLVGFKIASSPPGYQYCLYQKNSK